MTKTSRISLRMMMNEYKKPFHTRNKNARDKTFFLFLPPGFAVFSRKNEQVLRIIFYLKCSTWIYMYVGTKLYPLFVRRRSYHSSNNVGNFQSQLSDKEIFFRSGNDTMLLLRKGINQTWMRASIWRAKEKFWLISMHKLITAYYRYILYTEWASERGLFKDRSESIHLSIFRRFEVWQMWNVKMPQKRAE